MFLSWQNWCRICGNIEADHRIDQENFVKLIFQIESSHSSLICFDCNTYIQEFQKFRSKAQSVNEMFSELELKYASEAIDAELVLQIRLYYELSIPESLVENSENFEANEDTDMADDLVDVENFVLDDDSVDLNSTEYIIEEIDANSDYEQNLLTKSNELVEHEVEETREELVDNIIYEENDSGNNEMTDNEQFSEDQSRVETGVDDMSKHFEFRCHICDEVFNKMHFLTTHTKIEHGCLPRVLCQCGKHVGSTKAIQFHYQSHVLNTASFECNQCQKSYKTETHFKNHMTTHLGESFERLYQCECGKSFKEARHLNIHERTHLPDDQKFIHQCSLCNKSYSSIFSLRQHVKHVHVKNPTFKCQHCEKTFSRKANLESHLNHVHTTQRNFECEICGLKLKTKGILRMHKKIHSTNPEDLLTCEVCKRQFKTQNQLTNHKVSHSKEKRYKCNLCSAQYKRSKELTSHIASAHTLETKYTCQWCSKTFFNNSNYRKHKLKMHPDELHEQEIKEMIIDENGFYL